jgi:hypothetical protein
MTDFVSETFLLDSYTGQGGFATGEYLAQHPRESAAKFARRVQLAIRPNFVKKIVDSYLGYLFRVPPGRTSGSSVYDAFQANADGLGDSLDKVMQRAQKLAMIAGTAFVLVDREIALSVAAAAVLHRVETSRRARPDAGNRLPRND